MTAVEKTRWNCVELPGLYVPCDGCEKTFSVRTMYPVYHQLKTKVIMVWVCKKCLS